MKRTEKWYQRRLAEYCEERFGEFEDEIAFFINPSINEWMFRIPRLDLVMLISCDDNGVVREKKFTFRGAN